MVRSTASPPDWAEFSAVVDACETSRAPVATPSIASAICEANWAASCTLAAWDWAPDAICSITRSSCAIESYVLPAVVSCFFAPSARECMIEVTSFVALRNCSEMVAMSLLRALSVCVDKAIFSANPRSQSIIWMKAPASSPSSSLRLPVAAILSSGVRSPRATLFATAVRSLWR